MDNQVLGKTVGYKSIYDASLLHAIPRYENREEIGLGRTLPFYGFDCWNLYELSWLNAKGMPQVAVGEVYIPCESMYLIESKSFKLYLNSFNQTVFSSWEKVVETITKDLSEFLGASVHVCIHDLNTCSQNSIVQFEGSCLDTLDLEVLHAGFNNNWLLGATEDGAEVSETLFSNLLKSNCLITHQPDWGSVQLTYKGKAISKEKLLRYFISFRMHNEFHEQCVERIFMDTVRFCSPHELSVYARYTRRGGLDINPYRSSQPISLLEMMSNNGRLVRQ